MIGPKPAGFWTGALGAPSAIGPLAPGVRYRVVRPFVDFDRGEHAVGETWVFRGCSFAPHDDGLSLFVSLDADDEWHIRMQWIDDQQGAVLDALAEYVQRAPTE